MASEYWSMPPVFGYVPAITIDVDYISIYLIAVLDLSQLAQEASSCF
jgi:hypothetical protein